MADKLHKNYQKASNLIIAALLLDPIEFFLSKYLGMTKDEVVFEIIGLAFIALTAYAARRGVVWVKYVLLIFTLLGIVAIVMAVNTGSAAVAPLIVTFLQVIVMSWALVLLFQIPPPIDQDALDSDI